ncbi:MAG: pyridoxamine 5'-phosphate oxidase family protein [Actinomycetota bacterium]
MDLSPEAIALLRRDDVLVYLATTNEDGSPHVAPLWADVESTSGLIVLNTAEGRRKVHNVRKEPRVMIAAHAPEALWPPLEVAGTVVEITTDGADAHIDELSRRYTGEPWEPVDGQVRLRLIIRPDHVLAP